jgi:hypothetical protein
MVQIILEELKNKKDDIVTFLQDKLKTNVSVEGNKIIVEEKTDVNKNEVKTYLKRFLHSEGVRKSHNIHIEKDVIKITAKKIESKE